MKLKKIFLPLLAALLFAGCSAAPEAPAPADKFDAEVDYLIVGGGAAGIASAVEAADQGIENIMIVEKTGDVYKRQAEPLHLGTAFQNRDNAQGRSGIPQRRLMKTQNLRSNVIMSEWFHTGFLLFFIIPSPFPKRKKRSARDLFSGIF